MALHVLLELWCVAVIVFTVLVLANMKRPPNVTDGQTDLFDKVEEYQRDFD